jgi:hypothetical protein
MVAHAILPLFDAQQAASKILDHGNPDRSLTITISPYFKGIQAS